MFAGANFGGGLHDNYLTLTAVPEATALLFGGVACLILAAAHLGRKLLQHRAAV
jgi:hypothetical protein